MRLSLRILVAIAWVIGLATTSRAQAPTRYAGAIGPGSSYEIDVPDPWNGDLVLYAHGILEASRPVQPPSDQDGYAALREYLLESGFAVGASSYSSNGWALADAVRRTHQLRAIAVSQIGQPRRTFLVGHSMGALAIVKLAERSPTVYDGVLAMCGPLGGALDELEYAGHARVTLEYYFPGLLPGNMFEVPEGTLYLQPGVPGGPSPLFMRVYSAFLGNPEKVAQWASAARLPFNDPAEMFSSALYVVGFLVRYSTDLVDRVNGKMPFDNQQTVYEVTVSPDPLVNTFLSQLLNQGVDRIASDPEALNYYDHNYTPTGQIDIPVLTLHTTRDAGIPNWHEERFGGAAANAGRSHWLLQRPIDRWGHCAFEPAEVQTAFVDLVGWVTTGQRP